MESEPRWKQHGVRVVRADQLDINTPQTPGMNRAAAITYARAGAEKLWAGTVVIHPQGQDRPASPRACGERDLRGEWQGANALG